MTVGYATIKDVLCTSLRANFSKEASSRAWIFRYAPLLVDADNAFSRHNNGMIV
jgi:hypothetical protein